MYTIIGSVVSKTFTERWPAGPVLAIEVIDDMGYRYELHAFSKSAVRYNSFINVHNRYQIEYEDNPNPEYDYRITRCDRA